MAVKAFETETHVGGVSSVKPTFKRIDAVAVNTTQANCDILDIRGIGTALAVKPPGSVTSLTFYGAEKSDGTFVLIDDAGTNGVVTVTASRWKLVPAAVLAHGFIQMQSAGANGNCVVVGK